MANLKDINYGIGKYLELSDASDIPDIGTNRKNLDLLNFKVATNNAYALYNFKDGMIDVYVDETGVDTSSSTNETYDSSNDLYSPTGGNTNMTLISNTQTAQAAPDEGRLVLYEEDVDAITVGTDIKGYISRDGGSNWSIAIGLTEDTVYTVGGIDSYTKLMLHCDGSNSGTTFTDSSFSAHTITVSGNTHTDTAIKKFGTASAQEAAGTDYLTTAASSDFSITGDFTIDMWCYFVSVNTTLCGSQTNWDWNSASTNDWVLLMDANGYLTFNTKGVGGTSSTSGSYGGLTSWKHIAVERSGSTTTLYVDGVDVNGGATGPGSGTIGNSGNTISIGRASTNLTGGYNGYIDEFRFSNGIVRYGGAFTPEGSAYDITKRLLSGSIDISGLAGTTSMRYKVETLNTKDLKLHGASLLWG